MTNTHLTYTDLALDKFSGTDPDQDDESFVQLAERKINFSLGDAPADLDDLASYTFRKKNTFFSTSRTSSRVVSRRLWIKDGLMTWKVLQKVIELQNTRHKRDKGNHDTLLILYEDFVQGTYNEKPGNT